MGRKKTCIVCGLFTDEKSIIHDKCIFELYFRAFITGKSVKEQLAEIGIMNGKTYVAISQRWKRMQKRGVVRELLSRKIREEICRKCEAFEELKYTPFSQKKLLEMPIILC